MTLRFSGGVSRGFGAAEGEPAPMFGERELFVLRLAVDDPASSRASFGLGALTTFTFDRRVRGAQWVKPSTP